MRSYWYALSVILFLNVAKSFSLKGSCAEIDLRLSLLESAMMFTVDMYVQI